MEDGRYWLFVDQGVKLVIYFQCFDLNWMYFFVWSEWYMRKGLFWIDSGIKNQCLKYQDCYYCEERQCSCHCNVLFNWKPKFRWIFVQKKYSDEFHKYWIKSNHNLKGNEFCNCDMKSILWNSFEQQGGLTICLYLGSNEIMISI